MGQDDKKILGTIINWWDSDNKLITFSSFDGWHITRHESRTYTDIGQKYLYVATKQNEKKMVTNDWDTICKTISALMAERTVKELF